MEVRTWIPFPRLRVRATEKDDHTYLVEIWQQDHYGSWPPKWTSYLVVRTGDLHKILEEGDGEAVQAAPDQAEAPRPGPGPAQQGDQLPDPAEQAGEGTKPATEPASEAVWRGAPYGSPRWLPS